MVRDIKNKPHGPKAAWLCKQNKQLPVTITSTLLSRFAKLGGRDPPHGGVILLIILCIIQSSVTFRISWIMMTCIYTIRHFMNICSPNTEY